MHYIIGDVHGCLDELKALLDQVRPDSSDTIVFLGDLTGREGPDPIGTLKYVKSLPTQFGGDVRVLRGDAEELLLGALSQVARQTSVEMPWAKGKGEHLALFQWHMLAGESEVQKFQDAPKDELYDLVYWLNETGAAWEGRINDDRVLVVHAGIDPGMPNLTQQRVDALLYSKGWELRLRARQSAIGDIPWSTIVYGHIPVVNPGVREHGLVNIDGGCVHGGCLVAYRLEDHRSLAQYRRTR